MPIHPITKEKEFLKKKAAEIKSLKYFLRWTLYEGPDMTKRKIGVVEALDRSEHQRKLAKLKYVFRHRHYAYCYVRAITAKRPNRKIEGKSLKPFNRKLSDFFITRLLSKIAIAQSDRIDKLYAEIAGLKPCVAIFTSKTGVTKRLLIKDFERRPNGDFVWAATESGTVHNAKDEWLVRDNDAVWLTKREHDKLPLSMQFEFDVQYGKTLATIFEELELIDLGEELNRLL
jgi:hypothetical protein